ncbi:MAG: TonB family protein [Bacteroidia bacterium]|nr:TonB family protein [Bacteroidia bacterium]
MKSRKTHRANIEKTVPFFFRIGLITSITLAIVAFEWKSPYTIEEPEEEPWDPPIEITLKPIKFKIEKPLELPVEDKKTIVEKPIPIDEPDPVKKKTEEPIEQKDVPDGFMPDNEIPEKLDPMPVLLGAEIQPSFPGGESERVKFITDETEYPKMARKEGLTGRVFVSFVVNPNGEISDIKILKDIGGGCGAEAVRVVKKMPNWIPGRQGGKNVPVLMTMELNFNLNYGY